MNPCAASGCQLKQDWHTHDLSHSASLPLNTPSRFDAPLNLPSARAPPLPVNVLCNLDFTLACCRSWRGQNLDAKNVTTLCCCNNNVSWVLRVVLLKLTNWHFKFEISVFAVLSLILLLSLASPSNTVSVPSMRFAGENSIYNQKSKICEHGWSALPTGQEVKYTPTQVQDSKMKMKGVSSQRKTCQNLPCISVWTQQLQRRRGSSYKRRLKCDHERNKTQPRPHFTNEKPTGWSYLYFSFQRTRCAAPPPMAQDVCNNLDAAQILMVFISLKGNKTSSNCFTCWHFLFNFIKSQILLHGRRRRKKK